MFRAAARYSEKLCNEHLSMYEDVRQAICLRLLAAKDDPFVPGTDRLTKLASVRAYGAGVDELRRMGKYRRIRSRTQKNRYVLFVDIDLEKLADLPREDR